MKDVTLQSKTVINGTMPKEGTEENLNQKELELAMLLTISKEVASVRQKSDLFPIINNHLKNLFSFDDGIICILNKDKLTHSAFLYPPDEVFAKYPGCEQLADMKFSKDDGIYDVIVNSASVVVFELEEVIKLPNASVYVPFWIQQGMTQLVGVHLQAGSKSIGSFSFYTKKRNAIPKEKIELLYGICSQIAIAIENILINEEVEGHLQLINQYKKQLEVENNYLLEEIKATYKYSEIIGSGPEMEKVYLLMSQVAFANSTVLLLGETGTGKELIARAIHNGSPRKDKIMIKVNCAALPQNLIESELFGHERGSFTGATERRQGKFELAHNSTLFLDEIGEMPLDLQVKLLRVLQEKEIERVGGKNVIKVDVRIIAATNRDLLKEVAEGRFRMDLYYRLNVFPITLPPLRSRLEDIPVLTKHFIERLSRSTGKKVTNISQKALQELMNYNWPGNVRELEHLLERSLLLTNGPTIKEIQLPFADRKDLTNTISDNCIKSLEEYERDYIISVLKRCSGKIFGLGGAAERLGLPPSTLNSKMIKLGIKKEQLFDSTKSL